MRISKRLSPVALTRKRGSTQLEGIIAPSTAPALSWGSSTQSGVAAVGAV